MRDREYIHVIYGGEYDFNMFLRDVPEKALHALKTTNRVEWGSYTIEHIPRKWFILKQNKYVAKIFDVVSFFACPYVDALEEHKIGTDEEREHIRAGKMQRSGFTFDDLGYVEPYWETELKLLPLLMDKMRTAFHNAGVYINNWHGPGALARYALTHRKVKDAMQVSPEPVHDAARYAFCGGRFEPFYAGIHDGTIYNADINSAYPYAATFLPNLARGSWYHIDSPARERIRADEFAVYHIRRVWTNRNRESAAIGPQPLFRRLHDDRVQWPNRVEGWYWSPEAFTVATDPHAEILECFVFRPTDDSESPFAFIADNYRQRQILKQQGDYTQYTIKLMINSIYGQLAQRAGWQRGIPKFHQLEWAGFITSMCRAMIYEAARKAWDRGELISCDTDGIFTTGPIPETDLINGYGTDLGQWEPDTLQGMLFWQSGVYWVQEAGEWKLRKARGAPKGQIGFDRGLAALEDLESIHYTRNELIGYRWALRNRRMHEWRFFVERQRKLQFGGSPFSKRQHIPRTCRRCRGIGDQTLHDLAPAGNGFEIYFHSKMHVLPWEKNDHERMKDRIEDNEDIIDEIWSEEP